jgi:hypothetical protein
MPFAFGDQPLSQGQLVTVTCAVVEGDSPISLQWKFNGKNISSTDSYTLIPFGDRQLFLNIPSVEAKHAGNYSCMAKNPAGREEKTATLRVNGIIDWC